MAHAASLSCSSVPPRCLRPVMRLLAGTVVLIGLLAGGCMPHAAHAAPRTPPPGIASAVLHAAPVAQTNTTRFSECTAKTDPLDIFKCGTNALAPYVAVAAIFGLLMFAIAYYFSPVVQGWAQQNKGWLAGAVGIFFLLLLGPSIIVSLLGSIKPFP